MKRVVSRRVRLAMVALLFAGVSSAGGSAFAQQGAASARNRSETLSPASLSGLTLAGLESQITAAASLTDLPSTLVVPLPEVPGDTASAVAKGCLVNPASTTALGSRPASCYFGDVKAKRTMVLYGDSNAWMWLPAFNLIGASDKFRVEFDARADCEVANLPMVSENVTGCTLFRNYVFKRISATHPFATVMVDYEYYNHLMSPTNAPYSQSAYLAGVQSTVSTIKRDKSVPIMLSTPPPQLVNEVDCLSINPSNVQRCSVPTICLNGSNSKLTACTFDQDGTNLSIANAIGLSAAVKKAGGTYVSLAPLFCTSSTCPPVVDDTVVFFDQIHVSYHYSLLVARALSQLLPKTAL
jgi:hypothetical protein